MLRGVVVDDVEHSSNVLLQNKEKFECAAITAAANEVVYCGVLVSCLRAPEIVPG